MTLPCALLVVLAAASGSAPRPVEATSFAGEPLPRPELPEPFRLEQERLLEEADAALALDPDDADALVWRGRRLGYLGRYGEAIATFEAGTVRFPEDVRFLRHLGHRLITTRRIDAAVEVLSRAAARTASRADEVEPDGLPNEAGIPTSTLEGNIHYHLGLAHYLNGDFESAARGFGAAAALAANTDSAVASRYWLYLALARAGSPEAAARALEPVHPDWTILENRAYHRLALCFKGEADCDGLAAQARAGAGVEATTIAYGIAVRRLIDGDPDAARAILDTVVAGPDWASFGHVAAEADLAFDRTRPSCAPSLAALSVADLDRSVGWYETVLGFEARERHAFPDDGLHVAFVERDGFEIEIIERAGAVPNDPPVPGNPASRRGIVKLAFRSSGIDALYEAAVARGARVQSTLRPSNRTGGRFFILLDPDGNWIQVFGPASGSDRAERLDRTYPSG